MLYPLSYGRLSPATGASDWTRIAERCGVAEISAMVDPGVGAEEPESTEEVLADRDVRKARLLGLEKAEAEPTGDGVSRSKQGM